ncbi:MAG: hypothetical protein LBI77_02595 [Puniceicoccales bacterium]|jgi:hypothetical protein|nr:hypothetical protein [Puniceicoccales bacterium]
MNEIFDRIKAFWEYLLTKETWVTLWEDRKDIFKDIFTSSPFKCFIALCVLFGILRYWRRKRENLLCVYTTKCGLIFLKTSALRGVIKKICHGVIPQSKSRVKICTRWGKIKVRVSVACSHNMQLVSNQLQREIARTLREEVGINNLGSVHVVIEKIIGPLGDKNFDNSILGLRKEEEK